MASPKCRRKPGEALRRPRRASKEDITMMKSPCILRPEDLPQGLEPRSEQALRHAARLVAQAFGTITTCALAVEAAVFDGCDPNTSDAVCINAVKMLKDCAVCLDAVDDLLN